jgi:selenocysteine lyase/cysteine desulfurase
MEAIERYRHLLNSDPDAYLVDHAQQREQDVLQAASHYLRSDRDAIALTDSTTMGLGLLYGGLRLEEGDELLTTTHDFYSTHESLRQRAIRDRVTIRKVRLYSDPRFASVDGVVSALRAAIGPKTRVVALTWVHSGTGVKLPIRAIAEMLDGINAHRDPRQRALLCVDGVHGFGVEVDDVTALGCDFFVSGCHKWLFGPRGTGLIWGRRAAWARTSPTIPTFDSRGILHWLQPTFAPPASGAVSMTPGGFHAFEHRWALREAFHFHGRIGRARIGERTHHLARQLKEGLNSMPNVTLVTPQRESLSAGLVCFTVKNWAAEAAVEDLRTRGIFASVTPYVTRYVRLGPSIANSPDDVEMALQAIGRLR